MLEIFTDIHASPLIKKLFPERYISFTTLTGETTCPSGINPKLSKTSCLSSSHSYTTSPPPSSAETTHNEDVNKATAQRHNAHHNKNRSAINNHLFQFLDEFKLFTFRFCFIWSF
ncbi:hypothetical protein J6V86_00880 [bacterium]|nr:hypothetical protein [bacterium]